MGTRAKMSPVWRNFCRDQWGNEVTIEQAAREAEREALAILAETEPRIMTAHGTRYSSAIQLRSCGLTGAGSALAESLAAFVQS